jgi:putative transposase
MAVPPADLTCLSPLRVAADTYASPEHRHTVTKWGAWLYCANPTCRWNGSRDYAASLNIARLGAALVRHAQVTERFHHPAITDPSVQPVSYMGTWAALRLPPLSPRGHLMRSGRIYCNGWRVSVKLRSSYATSIMLHLCG